MTQNSINQNRHLTFKSAHFEKEVSSAELEAMSSNALRVLYSEAERVAAACNAKYEWTLDSTPTEWPDEDWPRRLKIKTAVCQRFAKLIEKELARRKAEQRLLTQSLLQERKIRNVEKQTELRATKIKYVKQVLVRHWGQAVMEDVMREAADLAERNKS